MKLLKKKVGWEPRELWCGWCLAICLVSFPEFRLNPGLRPWKLMCSSALPQELNTSLLLVRGSVSSSSNQYLVSWAPGLSNQYVVSWAPGSVLNSCFISICGSLIHDGYCLPDSYSSSSPVGYRLMTSCWKSLMTTIWPAHHGLNRNSHLQSVSTAQQNCP